MSPEIRARMVDENLTVEKLHTLMAEFEEHVEQGDYKELGWPKQAYAVSKFAVCFSREYFCCNIFQVTMLTRILAKQNPQVLINSLCPGWCRTGIKVFFETFW